jgi:hypothetical protein
MGDPGVGREIVVGVEAKVGVEGTAVGVAVPPGSHAEIRRPIANSPATNEKDPSTVRDMYFI